ncbi:MAG: prepilin-type N-terminal cleavage/methylation domain-containing protein [Candidatus Alcyoniella australis]|nr:prepilin-type N-terminal cleavage/methylation domain-containing protein [Candidatus Alcyoniella australis]
MKRKGFTLIELLIVISIIGILAMIAIPSFLSLRARARDAAAENLGRTAALAEEIYFQSAGGVLSGSYTSSISNLISLNEELDDDPDISWDFGASNKFGFTFTVWHDLGTERYVITDHSY